MIPTQTARDHYAAPQTPESIEVFVGVEPGAADVVGGQIGGWLSASHPDQYQVVVPAQTSNLQLAVLADLRWLFWVLGGVCLLVGMISIGNTTLVSVMERTAEFGLRRALGADSRDIAWQVLTEAGIIGGYGALWGAALGTVVVAVVCHLLEWTAMLIPWVVWGAPLLGIVVGVIAGTHPARRASRIEPIIALRS